MTEPTRKEAAESSIAERFSRHMKATTSPLGLLTDPALVGLATALALFALLAAVERGAPAAVQLALELLLCAPLLCAVLITLALSGARGKVIAWLTSLPFPLENLNAVLNGVGEELVVRFAATTPETTALNAELDKIHADVFVTSSGDESGLVEIRIGVVESKRNPAGSNHLRYRRVRAIVGDVLVPLSRQHPILEVRIK
jgi:hypothetical protein